MQVMTAHQAVIGLGIVRRSDEDILCRYDTFLPHFLHMAPSSCLQQKGNGL